jgi:hypothetical protein
MQVKRLHKIFRKVAVQELLFSTCQCSACHGYLFLKDPWQGAD